jgi:hypothetical protein
MRRIADLERDVVGAVALEVGAAERRQRRLEFDGKHARGAVRQERRQVPAAGSGLQHPVGLPDRQLLDHPRLHFRLPHLLALADRDLQVGEGERAVSCGDELLARHHVQKIKHVLVEHLPGADLLLDHIGAGLL